MNINQHHHHVFSSASEGSRCRMKVVRAERQEVNGRQQAARHRGSRTRKKNRKPPPSDQISTTDTKMAAAPNPLKTKSRPRSPDASQQKHQANSKCLPALLAIIYQISIIITVISVSCRAVGTDAAQQPKPLVISQPVELARLSPADDELATAATSPLGRTTRQLDNTVAAAAAGTLAELEPGADEPEPSSQPYDYHANMPVITKRELSDAIAKATSSVDKQALRVLHEAGPGPGPELTSEGESELGDLSSAILLGETSADSLSNSILLETGTPGWLASSMFHKPAPGDAHVLNQTRAALIGEETTRLLARQFKLSRHQIQRGLPLISVDQTTLGRQCPRSVRTHNCVPGRYRSLSGHCNNVQQPDWGSAQTPLVRYASARYADSISRPPRISSSVVVQPPATSAQVLPSARAVSVALHEAAAASGGQQSQQQQQHSHMTTMLSFFGQFLFHDLAFVPQFSKSIKCCPDRHNQARNSPSTSGNHQLHPECMPIELSGTPGAPSYCLDYVRSAPTVRNGCNLGPRDQLNLVSSFLDGSVIYGSSETQMRQLRAFAGGRLRSQRPLAGAGNAARSATGGGGGGQQPLELLPQIRLQSAIPGQAASSQLNASAADSHWLAAARDCYQMAVMRRRNQRATTATAAATSSREDSPAAMMQQMHLNCFQAGDLRVNENLGLTLMHTIWMREHNLIADKLAALNRHWHDERLFEEARRIVVAELQQVAYQEFLPSILGDEIMQRFNLTISSQGYFQGYEPGLNPGASNELATAVFPFILSTIPGALERYSDRLEMLGATSLADTFMDASDLFKRNRFAQYLTGMMSQSAMEPALGLVPMTMDQTSSGASGTGTGSFAPLDDDADNDDKLTTATNSSSVTTAAPMLDAVALTIQQGRDHGLRSYLYWRRVCQLRPHVKSWTDLEQVMPRAHVERLRRLYATPEQLDLYLALLEAPAPGATVGPTFVCLLARQFYQLKHGDRYWFENDLPGVAFTPGQLDELRQTSLAKVMCRNSQASISFIQPAPMLASDPFLNAYQYCTNKAMVDLDLGKWRQSVTSAQQLEDEQLVDELASARAHEHFGHERALARGKRLIEDNVQLIGAHLNRARAQLDEVARQEGARVRAAMATRQRDHQRRTRRHASAGSELSNANRGHNHHHHHHSVGAGYRYLPRLKRHALAIHNQSVILELATNEVVRSLLRQGKDRERAQSLQVDIRDFLYSLESLQLENLLDNAAGSERLAQAIAASNSLFLTDEQRQRLAAAGDPTLTSDPLNEILSSSVVGGVATRSSSISMSCQDDDRAYPCDHTTPFRTITGWCNNLAQPKWGQSYTQHDRILPSAYEDGLAQPRASSVVLASPETGERLPLPSARLISTTMHDDRTHLHVRYSLALMQFGQFGVDHDLTRTPFSVALDGSLLDCSACDSRTSLHRDCLPIEIPDNDAHFHSPEARRLNAANGAPSQTGRSGQPSGQHRKGKKCLHFVRSLNGQPALGPRQQLNALTSYLDASEIYGSDNCETKSLRAFTGGRLNSSVYPVGVNQPLGYTPREILPTTRLNPECATPSGLCFHAGDQRASEQPGLTAIHTIFLRLHNSIVDQLAALNRHWTDEKLFQHGRRIVGAILQRITYNEFAPRLLGLDYMSKFDLMLKQVGYSHDYDDSCSASILTEFAAAAFRMGHSLIRPAFPLLNRAYKPAGKAFQLRSAFFNSHRILAEPQLIDSVLRGIVSTPIETLDNSITEELTNHLFEKPREPFSGMDLIALNIQRARDHGIGGYNRYRAKCNLTRARTFDDLSGEIPARLIKRLETIYASVEDIDLFTGGLSETPVHGGIIGPTFGCIIGMQLARLKKCDRFWHETDDPYVRFSAPQLAEIRKLSLAKVICSQSDLIDTIQRQAMDVPDNYLNPRVACSSLPAMDLSVWRENQKTCLAGAGNKIKIELGASRRVSPCRSCTCTLEGPVCRTAKINCMKMMQKASSLAGRTGGGGSALGQVMADKSCLVQCAWTLDMQLLLQQ